MSARSQFARNLAAAFLAGSWSLSGLVSRGAQACGRRERWLRPLARQVLQAFTTPTNRPDEQILAHFIQRDPGFDRAWGKQPSSPHRVYWVVPHMRPAEGPPSTWDLPALPTPAALAEWLQMDLPHLDWFADCHGREAKGSLDPFRHYSYVWRLKRSGKSRLFEVPKPRLRALQRRVLHEVLDRIPPHEAVHGYRRGRSVATYSRPHCGQAIVLRFDLTDFFPSIPASRVHALFRMAGYPVPVARLLTGLCTNVVPGEVLAARTHDRPWTCYRSPHLPQGAPTSPALANLCCHRLDCRFAGLAESLDAHYTRYADDLAFSGGPALEKSARRFQVLVCRIALEEGFEINTRKSRFMRQGVRQQLAGVVLNRHLNSRRDEYDRLKAILTNCLRHGPASQNRDGHLDFKAHLAGRIAYVSMLNPGRGQRLRAAFDRVIW
jgi:RNA-directed DNA polymerase